VRGERLARDGPACNHGGVIWVVVVVGAFAGGLLLYGLHRLALWAESRGWIYYKQKRRPGGLGLSLIGQIYQPSIEHVVEQEQSERIKSDQDDSGDEPE
jgi:hypothetical protein